MKRKLFIIAAAAIVAVLAAVVLNAVLGPEESDTTDLPPVTTAVPETSVPGVDDSPLRPPFEAELLEVLDRAAKAAFPAPRVSDIEAVFAGKGTIEGLVDADGDRFDDDSQFQIFSSQMFCVVLPSGAQAAGSSTGLPAGVTAGACAVTGPGGDTGIVVPPSPPDSSPSTPGGGALVPGD